MQQRKPRLLLGSKGVKEETIPACFLRLASGKNVPPPRYWLRRSLVGGRGVSSVSLGEDVLHRVEGPGGLAFETRRLSGI